MPHGGKDKWRKTGSWRFGHESIVAGWVRRLVQAQGVRVPEATLGWWSWYLQEFIRYADRKGERVEVKFLAQEFVRSLEAERPPVKAFRVDQTRQALTVFLRGIENRHWESHGGRWRARFRVKAPVESAPCAVATTPSRGGRFEGCGDDWDEKMRREMRVRHYSIRTEQTYLQ